MKNLLLIVSLLIITMTSMSQVTKGNWLLGGSGSFYSYKQTHSSATLNTVYNYFNVDLSASIGYFLINKVGLGLRPSFSSVVGEIEGGGISTNIKKYSIGPFSRYYFLDIDKPFNILVTLVTNLE